MLYRAILLCVSCVSVSARLITIHCCNSSENYRQAAQLEQVLNTLQTINSQLQSIENRQKSIESRLESIENQTDPRIVDEDTRCRSFAGGKRTCYKLLRQNQTWSEGREQCQRLRNAEGADLVSTESRAEDLFVVNMLLDLQPNCEQIYTSGRLQSNGVWIWRATGQAVTYTGWSPSSPSAGAEDTITLMKHLHFQWNDATVTYLWCSICEFQ